MPFHRTASHPRRQRPPVSRSAVVPRRITPPRWIGALVGAVCIAASALLPGYALVLRLRVEVVPASAAPAPSGPAACATAVVRW
jgi:hypothetical protein